MAETLYKPLAPGHLRRRGDLPKIQTRYVVKSTYFFMSGVFFVLAIISIPIFINLQMTNAFAEEYAGAYRGYFLWFIGVTAVIALALRLRCSFCAVCNQFRWPTQIDYNDYCRQCGAHLFKFHVYKNQETEKSKHAMNLEDRLLEMAKRGDNDAISNLLSKGADVNYQDKYGNTALMLAAMENRLDSIDFLMAVNADPSLKNNFGLNALMLAADKRHVLAVRKLLGYGVDPNDRTQDGRNAMDVAIKNTDQEMIQVLKEWERKVESEKS